MKQLDRYAPQPIDPVHPHEERRAAGLDRCRACTAGNHTVMPGGSERCQCPTRTCACAVTPLTKILP